MLPVIFSNWGYTFYTNRWGAVQMLSSISGLSEKILLFSSFKLRNIFIPLKPMMMHHCIFELCHYYVMLLCFLNETSSNVKASIPGISPKSKLCISWCWVKVRFLSALCSQLALFNIFWYSYIFMWIARPNETMYIKIKFTFSDL